jgi:hypothetical protein
MARAYWRRDRTASGDRAWALNLPWIEEELLVLLYSIDCVSQRTKQVPDGLVLLPTKNRGPDFSASVPHPPQGRAGPAPPAVASPQSIPDKGTAAGLAIARGNAGGECCGRERSPAAR